MTPSYLIRAGVLASTLWVVVFTPSARGQVDLVEDKEFAALQTDARKSFREHLVPFFKTYCINDFVALW
ncbi:MAG: hypothetical protein ACOYMN_24695 [Roseimicrobium sp.]